MRTEFRTLLDGIVAESVGDVDRVALLLSGGVDSLSLGFAAESVGRRVVAYTFQVGEWASPDALSAERAAETFGWEFNLVKVPVDAIERDFVDLARRWKCVKKTQFECTWPFLYLVPAIREAVVLSGIAADGHFGLSRKAMSYHRFPKAAFDDFRRAYFASQNPAGQVQQRAVIESHGRRQAAPYLDGRVAEFFLRYDWNAINRPIQKILTLRAYPDEFRRVPARPHSNLQLNSGVNLIFESLLEGPLNTRGRTRVMDLCRDYADA